jgi:hypothetical protein
MLLAHAVFDGVVDDEVELGVAEAVAGTIPFSVEIDTCSYRFP